jgi:hypothetical protein
MEFDWSITMKSWNNGIRLVNHNKKLKLWKLTKIEDSMER